MHSLIIQNKFFTSCVGRDTILEEKSLDGPRSSDINFQFLSSVRIQIEETLQRKDSSKNRCLLYSKW